MRNEDIQVIEPNYRKFALELDLLWKYRDLIFLLAKRDISARFRQSIVGYGWAILRPLITALIFTLVFSYFLNVETEVPYPIFAFAGLMPWMFFATSLSSVTASIVGGGALITKVYFPRLVLPIAQLAVGTVELALQFIVLIGLMAYFQFFPGWQIIFLPVFVIVTIMTALAFGIWLTAFNVRYRDIGLAVPFLIQIWMYLTPIVYPINLVPEEYRTLYALNPMVGVVEGFRWSLFGSTAPGWEMIVMSSIVVVAVFVFGLIYFRKVERSFADII